TGAARRVGRAIACKLAEAGWDIAIHYNTSGADAEETLALCRKAGAKAQGFAADLTDQAAARGLIPAVATALAPVPLLVNNATVFENDTAHTQDRELWDLHMEVNLRAPFVLCQALMAGLPEGIEGNIVNLVDQRVLSLTPFFTSYTLSRVGLWTLT